MSEPRRLEWIAEVACEGGPLLVCDTDAFVAWTGGRSRDLGQKTLHIWGQFTGDLPERFRPAGPSGHQFVEAETPDQALEWLAELRKHVRETWPDTTEALSDRGVRFQRPDFKQLNAEIAPASVYDAACMAGKEQDAWLHPVAGERKGLLWEVEGGGVVQVGRSIDRSELVLQRSWLDAAEQEENVCAEVDAPRDDEEVIGQLDLLTGTVVAIWSPVAAAEITGVDGGDPDALMALGDQASLSTEAIAGLGALIELTPGSYRVQTASHEDEEWSCRWCRLIQI